MEEVYSEFSQRASNNWKVIFDRVQKYGQNKIADRLSLSEPTISEFINNQKFLDRATKVLAALDLKVVPAEMKCYPEETLAALLVMAKERMAQIESPQQLAWEE